MTFRRLLSVALLVACGPSVSSCLSPTLPLPPPDPPTLVAEDATTGEWQVEGDCIPGATVEVINNATRRGAVVEDIANSGIYTVVISGTECDVASVIQTVAVDGNEEQSGATEFVLVPFSPSTRLDPNLCMGP
jgi:hypothetical protein